MNDHFIGMFVFALFVLALSSACRDAPGKSSGNTTALFILLFVFATVWRFS